MTEKLTDRVCEKRRIRVNTDKRQNPRHYRDLVESVRVPKTVRSSIKKRENSREYRSMGETEVLSGSGRIRTSTEKLTDRVWEKGRIHVNTDKWQNPRDYQDQVESVRVPKK